MIPDRRPNAARLLAATAWSSAALSCSLVQLPADHAAAEAAFGDGAQVSLTHQVPDRAPPRVRPLGGGELSDTWIGAAAADPIRSADEDSGLGVFDESNADIGPLVFRRSFDSSLPVSFAGSAAGADAAYGYRSFVS
ncbi:MAG: hypothetical protein M3513_15680, partial [Actinomycetota bacterium]|nr:hypothetical protein [Actinomycetota bacterium]